VARAGCLEGLAAAPLQVRHTILSSLFCTVETVKLTRTGATIGCGVYIVVKNSVLPGATDG